MDVGSTQRGVRDDVERLDALERRVAVLERRTSASTAAFEGTTATAAPATPDVTTDEATLDPVVFWALVGLESRVAPPGAVMIAGSVTTTDGRARWQQGAASQDLLDDDWAGAAERLSALGHPVRLRLLREVLRGTTTARGLGDVEGIGTSGQVYHHLRLLTAAGWLRNRGSHYEVPAEVLVPLLTIILAGRR